MAKFFLNTHFHTWLRTLGLHRRVVRAWAMYDWASSAFNTSVMAAILPIYYHKVAAADIDENLRTAYWGYTQTIALVSIVLLAPLLGAAADYAGRKKNYLASFVALGLVGTSLLAVVGEGDWVLASAIFVLASIGLGGAEVFYESLLPHITNRCEIDRVSAAGYALGYVGGGLLLAVHLAWISNPDTFGFQDSRQASRAAFLTVAVWWALFTIPLLRVVPEPASDLLETNEVSRRPLTVGLMRVAKTFGDLQHHRELFLFLLAFWCYNDGINTIIKMSTIYGTEIGIGQDDLVGALLLVQFLGIPATFSFGYLAQLLGPKRCLYFSLIVYSNISVLGFFMTEAWHFWVLACGVAMVQGGSQALSRSLYASMIPRGRSAEFFGFYNVSGKFGNILGPLVFGLVSQLSGNSRMSILALVGFFLGGMLLLTQVNIESGQAKVSEENIGF